MKFTGERLIPGNSPTRVEEDHIERYLFASQFVANKRVLDIACGVGYGSKIMMDNGNPAIIDSIDISEEAIKYAKNNFNHEGINYFTGDILSYRSNQLYDVVVCFETIEHLFDHKKALINIYENLNIRGILIISTPNRLITSPESTSKNQKIRNSFHFQEFTIEEMIVELESIGFNIDSSSGLFGQRLCTINDLQDESSEVRNKKSAKVELLRDLIPRYFTIIAFK